jgi:hypothetical protein
MVQVTFIVLQKTLYRYSQTFHAFIFLILFFLFTSAAFKLPTFNYKRAWMWNVVSHACVFWGALLATINMLSANHISLIVLLFFGWAMIILAGVLLQRKRYPSMLFDKKEVTIEDAFIFVFRSKGEIKPIRRELNYVNSTSMRSINSTIQMVVPDLSMDSQEAAQLARIEDP